MLRERDRGDEEKEKERLFSSQLFGTAQSHTTN